jgi:hypothetical protein
MSMFMSKREKLYIEVVSSAIRGWSGRLSGPVREVADIGHTVGMQALRNYDMEFSKPKLTPHMFLRRLLKPKS